MRGSGAVIGATAESLAIVCRIENGTLRISTPLSAKPPLPSRAASWGSRRSMMVCRPQLATNSVALSMETNCGVALR